MSTRLSTTLSDKQEHCRCHPPHPFDLVVRNARVATASDTFEADIGVRGGRIVQLGAQLGAGAREIDAAGRVVTPGGVDAHCHLDQPMAPPVRMADDFDTGTRAAACGGTTTVIPFAAQEKGQSLRAAVADYHHRAEGRAHVDYAFHLIVSDPTPAVLNDELPALIARGLHLVQGLHDLRRPEARRRPDPRRARRSRASTARWRWCMPRTPTASSG